MTDTDVPSSGGSTPRRPPHARRAAGRVVDEHSVQLRLPEDMGTIRLPEPRRLAFYGGVAALAALGVVDWPVAVLLGIGHLLADDHHDRCLCDFGEALEEA